MQPQTAAGFSPFLAGPVATNPFYAYRNLHFFLVIAGYLAFAFLCLTAGLTLGDRIPKGVRRRLFDSFLIALFFAPGAMPVPHAMVPTPAAVTLLFSIVYWVLAGFHRSGVANEFFGNYALAPIGIGTLLVFFISPLIPRFNRETEKEPPGTMRATFGAIPFPGVSISGLLVLALYFSVSIAGVAIPIGPAPESQRYFPRVSLADEQINRLIKQLKRTPMRSSLESNSVAEELAHRPGVIPYLVRLSWERAVMIHWLGIYIQYPYQIHAAAVLGKISSPDAVTDLKAIVLDPHLGDLAKSKLIQLKAPMSAAEVSGIIASDAKGYRAASNLGRTYAPMIENLPPEQQAQVLLAWLNQNGQTSLGLGGGANIHSFGYMSELTEGIRLLAKTRSPKALVYASDSAHALSSTLSDVEAESKSPTQMRWYSDAGREHAKQKLDRLPVMISEFKKAMAQLAKDIPVSSGLWTWTPSYHNYEHAEEEWLNEYQFSFSIWGLKPGAEVTVLLKDQPITDKSGVRWDHHQVALERGAELPYERRFDVIWAPAVPMKYNTSAKIIVRDSTGHQTEGSVYSLRLVKFHPKKQNTIDVR